MLPYFSNGNNVNMLFSCLQICGSEYAHIVRNRYSSSYRLLSLLPHLQGPTTLPYSTHTLPSIPPDYQSDSDPP